MNQPPKIHPFKNLYTKQEQALLHWEEKPLPAALPESIRELAIRGEDCHPFLAGRKVWFWDKQRLHALLTYLETSSSAESVGAHIMIDFVLAMEKKDAEYELGHFEDGLDLFEALEPEDVRNWLAKQERLNPDKEYLYSVDFCPVVQGTAPGSHRGQLLPRYTGPKLNWLRIAILTLVLGYAFYAMTSCYITNGLRF
ncbi:MAG: hypothetical protein R3F46_07540 [bacterium]